MLRTQAIKSLTARAFELRQDAACLTVAEIVLITIGVVTLAAVLVGLGLHWWDFRLKLAERAALTVVHLHFPMPTDAGLNLAHEAYDALGATPDGFTRCGEVAARVTSHLAKPVAYRDGDGMVYAPTSALSEVDEPDRCSECWSTVKVFHR